MKSNKKVVKIYEALDAMRTLILWAEENDITFFSDHVRRIYQLLLKQLKRKK